MQVLVKVELLVIADSGQGQSLALSQDGAVMFNQYDDEWHNGQSKLSTRHCVTTDRSKAFASDGEAII